MFRKPKKKPSALRGAAASSGSGVGGGGVAQSSGPSAGKKRIRRRRSSSSSSDEGNSDNEEGEGTSNLLQQIRQERDAKKSGSGANGSSGGGAVLLNTSSTSTKKKKTKKGGDDSNWMHQYKSTDNQMSAQEMATRTAEYHPTEGKQIATNEDASKNAEIAAVNTKQPRNAFHAGPLRAATFVRTTARFDYQPDICKDYKETGFCGFGDTCIYLHDRGDTKTGWQMEQEYEEKKKRDAERKGREMEKFMESMMCGEIKEGDNNAQSFNGEDGGAGVEEDGIPFACHICRSAFTNPIVTPCGHYFCEKCMLSRIKEEGTTGCPICKKDTHGVLNHPQKLVAKKRRLVGRDGTWEEYLERSQRKSDGDE